jgi:hypothetical protein
MIRAWIPSIQFPNTFGVRIVDCPAAAAAAATWKNKGLEFATAER